MENPNSVELARILEEVRHLLNSPMIDTALQNGEKVEFSFEIWTKTKADDYSNRIEYRREMPYVE